MPESILITSSLVEMDTGIRQYDDSCMFLAQGTEVVLFKYFPLRLSVKSSAYSALKIHFPANKKGADYSAPFSISNV